MRETRNTEFKETITNSFLKTVSAFASYEGGSVIFGMADDGRTIGLDNPVQTCLDIENKINDSITPQPAYSLDIDKAKSTVELKVNPGPSKPYLYKSKAYKRSDSATVETDALELTRLILEGRNIGFEELPCTAQSLSFEYLGRAMKDRLGLSSFNEDTLKTLNLLSRNGEYNNAAALLADENDFPGIDTAVFGSSIDIIRKRLTSERKSILAELDETLNLFTDQYRYEEISGFVRKTVETIPFEAFREALANALVHRTWDVSAHVRVSMFDDRIEISSPGGLPVGISEEEYLADMVSVRRNPIVANVFYRLGIIEAFGTGIHRIKAAYESSASKPRFLIGENSITVSLPVLKENLALSDDERFVYDLLDSIRAYSGGELHAKVDFSRSKLNGILKKLVAENLVKTEGSGRGLKYRKIV